MAVSPSATQAAASSSTPRTSANPAMKAARSSGEGGVDVPVPSLELEAVPSDRLGPLGAGPGPGVGVAVGTGVGVGSGVAVGVGVGVGELHAASAAANAIAPRVTSNRLLIVCLLPGPLREILCLVVALRSV